jgi:hypothetical protein
MAQLMCIIQFTQDDLGDAGEIANFGADFYDIEARTPAKRCCCEQGIVQIAQTFCRSRNPKSQCDAIELVLASSMGRRH